MKKLFSKSQKIISLIIFCFICCLELFSNQLFFAKIDTKEKMIFLTFDDGPGPWTREILSILKKYNVKATFFVLGELVKYREDVLKEVYSTGNDIGIHLYSHKNFYQIQKKYSLEETKKIFEQEIESSIKQIKTAIGLKPKYLRMPHGYYRLWMNEILKKYGLVVINWTFGCDWHNINSEEMLKKYKSNLQCGAIYLFHDGGKNREKTVYVVENFIKYALDNGYSFGILKDYLK